jgi:hypothetical protein
MPLLILVLALQAKQKARAITSSVYRRINLSLVFGYYAAAR